MATTPADILRDGINKGLKVQELHDLLEAQADLVDKQKAGLWTGLAYLALSWVYEPIFVHLAWNSLLVNVHGVSPITWAQAYAAFALMSLLKFVVHPWPKAAA